MLNFREMQELYIFNNHRRDMLLQEANKFDFAIEKIKFVVDYFLNNLSPEQTALIDEVPISKLSLFKYDYSFLQGHNDQFTRKQEVREYAPGRYGYTLSQCDCIRYEDELIHIYPNVYALKMATCIMFANELKRFAVEFGIDCEIVNKLTPCYDFYKGQTSEYKPLETDRIINMNHYYNIFEFDGVKYKIDIAGALTAADFNANHPEQKIDLTKFYFSTDLSENPFEKCSLPTKPPAQPH